MCIVPRGNVKTEISVGLINLMGVVSFIAIIIENLNEDMS